MASLWTNNTCSPWGLATACVGRRRHSITSIAIRGIRNLRQMEWLCPRCLGLLLAGGVWIRLPPTSHWGQAAASGLCSSAGLGSTYRQRACSDRKPKHWQVAGGKGPPVSLSPVMYWPLLEKGFGATLSAVMFSFAFLSVISKQKVCVFAVLTWWREREDRLGP